MNISLPRSGEGGIILGPEQIKGRRHAILQDIRLSRPKGPCLLPLCVAGSRMAVTLQMNRGWSREGLDFSASNKERQPTSPYPAGPARITTLRVHQESSSCCSRAPRKSPATRAANGGLHRIMDGCRMPISAGSSSQDEYKILSKSRSMEVSSSHAPKI